MFSSMRKRSVTSRNSEIPYGSYSLWELTQVVKVVPPAKVTPFCGIEKGGCLRHIKNLIQEQNV